MRRLILAAALAGLLGLGACADAPEPEIERAPMPPSPAQANVPTGDRHALFAEALRYGRGDGVPKDEAKAAAYLRAAADAGHAEAQAMMGAALATEGKPDDAAQWYALAAEQGHAEAQFRLAEAWLNGNGVPGNAAWAAMWFGRAASAGHVTAQFMYGTLLVAGRGVASNREGAYVWLALAAARGHAQAADFRDRLAPQLSPESRKRAETVMRRYGPAASAGYVDAHSIRFMQTALAELGFQPGAADGIFGPRTRAALQAYRDKKDLRAGSGPNRAVAIALRDDLVARK